MSGGGQGAPHQAPHQVPNQAPQRAPQRAAVIGAGSMGTLIASVLGQAMPVVLVCRNEDRAAELFRSGAVVRGEIESASRPIVVRKLEDVASAGGADLIFVATKTTAIPGVADELSGLLGSVSSDPSGPVVVSFQNGIDPGRQLMERLGHPRVIRMVLSLGASLADGGGCVVVPMNNPPHAIGSVDESLQPDCVRIASLLTAGGLASEFVRDIESAVWRKAIANAALNPVAALVNCSIGDVLDSPSKAIVDHLIQEGVNVAQAEGIALPPDYIARLGDLLNITRAHVPSMVQDIRGGRETEIGQLNRQIIEHGRELGVPTPTHDTVDALIETFDWKVYRA